MSVQKKEDSCSEEEAIFLILRTDCYTLIFQHPGRIPSHSPKLPLKPDLVAALGALQQNGEPQKKVGYKEVFSELQVIWLKVRKYFHN